MTPISIYSGESKNLIISIVDENSNPVDISAATFKWKLNVRNNPVIKQSPSTDISIVNGLGGKVQIILHPNDTSSISSGNYTQDLQITDSNNNVSVIQLDMLQILSSPF